MVQRHETSGDTDFGNTEAEQGRRTGHSLRQPLGEWRHLRGRGGQVQPRVERRGRLTSGWNQLGPAEVQVQRDSPQLLSPGLRLASLFKCPLGRLAR